MNRRALLIGGAVVLIFGFLVWLGLQRPKTEYGTHYTDSISGEGLVEAAKTNKFNDGEVPSTPVNEIIITGLDSFVRTIDQNQSAHIQSELIEFIRARVGAKAARAGALNADVQKISDKPTTYQFTLVIVDPASRYTVTITMPQNGGLTAADVTFGDPQP